MNKIQLKDSDLNKDIVLDKDGVNVFILENVTGLINIKVNGLDKLFIYMDSSDVKVNFDINNNLIVNTFSYDSTLNTNLDINMEKIELNYIYSVVNEKENSLVMNINHNKKDTSSKVINHGLNLESEKLLFEINAVIPKDITGVKTSQDNKIILMKDNNSRIEPNLLVDNDDVEASHSCYIGEFKEDDLFYLATRGLDKKDAIKILSRSFILGNMDISFEERELILDKLDLYWR